MRAALRIAAGLAIVAGGYLCVHGATNELRWSDPPPATAALAQSGAPVTPSEEPAPLATCTVAPSGRVSCVEEIDARARRPGPPAIVPVAEETRARSAPRASRD